jgi:gliding motility-associated-like protein
MSIVKIIKTALFCILLPLSVYGQVQSSLGRMVTAYAKGCAPFTVTIEEVDDLGDISRTYTYEPGLTSTSDTFHTYTAPGTYQIIQLLGEDIIPKTDTLVIEVLENTAPTFNLLKCDSEQAVLTLPDSIYDGYQVEVNTDSLVLSDQNAFSALIPYVDSLSLTLAGFYTNSAPNCQSLDTVLVRQNTPAIEAPRVDFLFECINRFTSTITLDGNTDQLYRISITDENDQIITSSTSTWSEQAFNFTETIVNPQQTQLCIQLEAISACDNSIQESYRFCEAMEVLNSPIAYAFASFKDDSLAISLYNPSNTPLSITTYVEDQMFLQSVTASSYFSIEYSLDARPTVEIEYPSNCPEDKLTYSIAPPFLEVDRIGINSYIIQNTSSQYISQNTTEPNRSLYLTGLSDSIPIDPLLPELKLNIENGNPQTLVAVESFDSVDLFSKPINIAYEYYVYVPDAFSPNDDGINDRLILFGLPTDRFNFKVFNRWGEQIFETSEKTNFWNGRLTNGHILEGTYVYRLTFYNELGELFSQQGSFALIRE